LFVEVGGDFVGECGQTQGRVGGVHGDVVAGRRRHGKGGRCGRRA
jgi:hypothetical protein